MNIDEMFENGINRLNDIYYNDAECEEFNDEEELASESLGQVSLEMAKGVAKDVGEKATRYGKFGGAVAAAGLVGKAAHSLIEKRKAMKLRKQIKNITKIDPGKLSVDEVKSHIGDDVKTAVKESVEVKTPKKTNDYGDIGGMPYIVEGAEGYENVESSHQFVSEQSNVDDIVLNEEQSAFLGDWYNKNMQFLNEMMDGYQKDKLKKKLELVEKHWKS
jgi:hypothetical protein